MSIIGYQRSTPATNQFPIVTSAGFQMAFTTSRLIVLTPGYIRRIGATLLAAPFMGYVWLGVWTLDESAAPETLICRTDRLPLGLTWGDVNGPVTWVNPLLNPVSQSAALMQAGERLAIGVKFEPIVANSGFFWSAADDGAIESTTLYLSNAPALNTPPNNPFAPSAALAGVAMAAYIDYDENIAPVVGYSGPADTAVIDDAIPTFSGTFTDANNTGEPSDIDKMSSYEIEIVRDDTGALIWGGAGAIVTPSPAERAANAWSWLYTGPTLDSGVVYRWRAQVYDDSGAASGFGAARTFSISTRGRVDTATDGVPFGKIDTASNLIDFTGRWSHPNAHAMSHAQVIGLWKGRVVRTGAIVAKSVSGTATPPGNPFTVQDFEAGIGSIPEGTWQYSIIGKSAVDGLWSTLSPPREFTINSRPTQPSNLQPPGNASSTSFPLLEWNVTDPDADDVFGVDADSELQITAPNGTTTTYTTSNYNAARKVGFLQLSGVHVPAFGNYKWRVRGRDTSAGALGIGLWSAYQTFNYVSGPVVTITNPTADEIENTSVPTVAWSNTGGTQVRARVVLYEADSPTPLKQQTIEGSLQTFQIPVGWISKLNFNYDLTVTVWIAGEINGTSLRRQFSVSYTTPLAPNNVQVTGYAEQFDHPLAPSSILVSTDPSQYGPGEFAGRNIYRRHGNEPESAKVLIRTITNPAQTSWRDAWAPSNIMLIYGVSQLRRVGATILESPIVWVPIQLDLEVPILVSAYDPSIRFPCMYMERDYGGKVNRPNARYYTWGSGNKRTKVTTPAAASSRTVRMSVTVRNDARGSMYDHIRALERLVSVGHPLLFRTQRPEERMYCDVEWEWSRGGVGERVMKMTLEEIDFTPGQGGGS